jgi:hypothetical protein
VGGGGDLPNFHCSDDEYKYVCAYVRVSVRLGQCQPGTYTTSTGGCVPCPPDTTSTVVGAYKCLPQCPIVSTLMTTYVSSRQRYSARRTCPCSLRTPNFVTRPTMRLLQSLNVDGAPTCRRGASCAQPAGGGVLRKRLTVSSRTLAACRDYGLLRHAMKAQVAIIAMHHLLLLGFRRDNACSFTVWRERWSRGVFSTSSPSLPWVRTVGTSGSGSVVGGPLQLGTVRYICTLPFKTASVIMDDVGNARVTEVDVVTGFLVRVWKPTRGSNVAASLTMVAISGGDVSLGTQHINLYDTAGSLLRSITSGLGTPWGMRFSMDGSYLVMVDQTASAVGSLKTFRTSDGAALTPMSTAVNGLALTDVEECMSSVTGAVGLVFLNDASASTIRVVDGVSATAVWSGSWNRAMGFAVVPRFGVVVAAFSSNVVVVLSSIQIATHPVSASVTMGTPSTFTIALSATSATSGVTYSWTLGGVPVGTNSSSYTNAGGAADGGTQLVVCSVTHATGWAVSNAATLTVKVKGTCVTSWGGGDWEGGGIVAYLACD